MIPVHIRSLGALMLTVISASALAEEKLPGVTRPEVADPVSSGNIMQMLFGLIIVIALMFALAWIMRRFTGFQAGVSGNLKVIGGLSLGTRERIVLVQAGDTQLLVGVAPGHVQTLHVLNEPLDASASTNTRGSFSDNLKAALKGQKP